jgi:hypothetical protein
MLALKLLLPTLISRKLLSDFGEAVAAEAVVIMTADVLQSFG